MCYRYGQKFDVRQSAIDCFPTYMYFHRACLLISSFIACCRNFLLLLWLGERSVDLLQELAHTAIVLVCRGCNERIERHEQIGSFEGWGVTHAVKARRRRKAQGQSKQAKSAFGDHTSSPGYFRFPKNKKRHMMCILPPMARNAIMMSWYLVNVDGTPTIDSTP